MTTTGGDVNDKETKKSNKNTNSNAIKLATAVTAKENDNTDVIKKILQPHPHDILFGRGGRNHHGNHVFRALINKYKELFRNSPQHYRTIIAAGIVAGLLSDTRKPGGRFIDRDKNGWFVVTFKRSVDKTNQALREKFKAKVIEREKSWARDGYIGPDEGLEPTKIYIDSQERVVIPGKYNEENAVGVYDNVEIEKELERKRQLEELQIEEDLEREMERLKKRKK
mmetsp:Transcript_59658/g.69720  ORF Transcript_59658/g.69720 Transcript_59658/m.69720 type:complete len:225 (-) Transcript_59658:256-930(-)|eukprot:CAMPEP_0194380654 /NCGR_PEP_ID=MMETSP0174-20130528/46796_1 /TAXON_ID=216777 /ORGANISM="Proboscia alata, Strain PI-D3" /LENGTH=224 /DNA_ID=CAMNT_0039164249 /DNA_START=35 /DNA_END=709 /DNA_ORIENTATION=-